MHPLAQAPDNASGRATSFAFSSNTNRIILIIMKSQQVTSRSIKTIAIGFLLLMSSAMQAQLTYDWGIGVGSVSSDFATGIHQDDQGNVYTFSLFTDTVDLDPGTGVDLHMPLYDRAYIVSKWSKEGAHLWSNAFHTPGSTGGTILEVRDSKVLLTLRYTDSLMLVHAQLSETIRVNPGQHVCIMNLSLDGEVLGIEDLFDSQDVFLNRMRYAGNDGYIGGGAFLNSVHLETVSGDTMLHSLGSGDVFIARFNSQWKIDWIHVFSSPKSEELRELNVVDQRIYLAVEYNDTLNIETHQGVQTFPCANNRANSLFGKLEMDGTALTLFSFGGDQNDEVRGIFPDQEGNLYICGGFTGEVNFQHPDATPVFFTSWNEDDGFVASYRPDGHLRWVRIFRDSDYGSVDNLIVHRNESLYFSGGWEALIDLDPGPDSLMQTSGSWGGDMYTAKMSLDGDIRWIYPLEGEQLEAIVDQLVTPDGRVILFGFHYGPFDGNPSAAIENRVEHHDGSDVFVISLTEENVITSAVEPSGENILLYPNPATTSVNISGDATLEQIRVYTTAGVELPVTLFLSGDSARVELDALRPGWYVITIKTPNAFFSKPIIKL